MTKNIDSLVNGTLEDVPRIMGGDSGLALVSSLYVGDYRFNGKPCNWVNTITQIEGEVVNSRYALIFKPGVVEDSVVNYETTVLICGDVNKILDVHLDSHNLLRLTKGFLQANLAKLSEVFGLTYESIKVGTDYAYMG